MTSCKPLIYIFQSQAEAHYKGNRHARRVKGIETSKTARLQDGDKQHPPPTASPTPPGPSPSSPEPDPNKPGGHRLGHMMLHTHTEVPDVKHSSCAKWHKNRYEYCHLITEDLAKVLPHRGIHTDWQVSLKGFGFQAPEKKLSFSQIWIAIIRVGGLNIWLSFATIH